MAMLGNATVSAQDDAKYVAILEPEANAAVSQMNKLLVRGVLKDIIVKTKAYRPLARNDAAIDSMLKELMTQRSELFDPDKAKELGKMLQADLICAASLYADKGEILIGCDIIDVQTGEIFNSGMVYLSKYTSEAILAALQPEMYKMLGLSDGGKPVPTHPVARQHYEKGKLFFEREDYEIAVLEFSEAIKLDPKVAEYLAWRGRANSVKGDYDSGLRDCNEAIRIDPNIAMAYYSRGNAYQNKKDYDSAIRDYNQAIRIDPNYAMAYNNRGNAYQNKKDYDSAIRDYSQAIRIDPNYSSAYYNRGNAYQNKKDYDSAIRDYSQAIRIDPNYAMAYNNRGIAYQNKKDYDSAIRDYSQAIRIDPNHASAYNNRGIAYEAKGDKKKANADYTKAKELGFKE
jgi:tetratricopeptide (TPR) repeat protein